MANMIVGPKFEMIASATLTLADVRDSISIFDLPENSAASTDGGSTELPLFGKCLLNNNRFSGFFPFNVNSKKCNPF